MASFTTKLSLGQKAFVVYGGLEPYINELTVGQIRVIETHPKAKSPFSQNSCYIEEYMCFETGVGSGSIFTYSHNIFATKEEAEKGVIKHKQKVWKQREERDRYEAERRAWQIEKDLQTLKRLKEQYEKE